MTKIKNIIFCNENDNIDIFKSKNPYRTHLKIYYVAKCYLFNPPFFEIIILNNTRNETDEDIKLLWNMTILNHFLVLPEKYTIFFNNKEDIKPYNDYIMVHKKSNIVYNPINKYRVVDFIIMGTQKGGTTSAMINLSKHNEISLYKEEIHFFDLFWSRGLNWYKTHFNYDKKMVGEKTPDLMYLDWTFPLIQSLNPYVKMIFFLRNPIDRAYSSWNMVKKNYKEKKTFEECIEEELKYRMNENKNLQTSTYHFLQRGLYYEQITKLLKYFPIQNMLFLISENVKKEPLLYYNKIFEFLNVSENNTFEYTEEFTSSYDDKIDKKYYNKLKKFFEKDVKNLEKLLKIKTNWFS